MLLFEQTGLRFGLVKFCVTLLATTLDRETTMLDSDMIQNQNDGQGHAQACNVLSMLPGKALITI